MPRRSPVPTHHPRNKSFAQRSGSAAPLSLAAVMGVLLLSVLALAGIPAGPAIAVAPASPVTEYPVTLNPDWKGRTVAVAVSPVNDNVAFVASDNGGLFKTTNQGASWSHVDSFPAHSMDKGDIAFFPDAANILIASGNADSQTINGGGILRSVDGGATWQKPATSDSPDAGCTADRNAFGIGITTGGNVYVGTACGVAISHDFGATWTHVDPPGPSRQVNDVVAQPGGIVDICAQDGHHRSINFGGAWTAPDGPGCNSIDVSPFEDDVLFASTSPGGGGVLWEGDPDGSGGFTWTQLFAPTNSNGRPSFVKTHPATDGDANHFDVFFMDKVLTYRQHCVNQSGAGLRCPVQAEDDPANDCPSGSTADCGTPAACSNAVDDDGDQIVNEGCPANDAAETTGQKDSTPECNDALDGSDGDGVVNDGCPVMLPYGTEFHAWFDHTDIGFETSSPTGCPILFTGDGGIAKSTDCGATWPDASNGLAALEIYEVTGTVHNGAHTDLYFGTQDTLIWASPDNGVTWPGKVYWEGQYLQAPLSATGDYEMTGIACGPCFSFRRTQHFDSDLGWPRPPGGGGWPFLIEAGPSGTPTIPGRYAQVSQNTLYITEPETGAECANAIDDDADNAVNDGCPTDGSPETGAQCHDAVDNDDGGSGPINEGCSSLNSAESGTECDNATDDDSDGFVNDGCPKDGDTSESDAACADAVDDNEDAAPDKINDGCPEIGVWAPTGPAVPALAASRLYVIGPPAAPTIYILTDKGATTGISKISAISNGAAVITAADSGLTDVAPGNRIGIDPNDAQHLIVADVGAGSMMVSTDGGATWTPDLQLTALVTDNGRLKFSYAGGRPQARSIMFDPADGNRILVGTQDGGIIATLNGGEHWFHVEGSNDIPTITSFFFDSFNDIVWVSSYGRGLWQLSFPETDLSVTKTDSPDPVMAGEELFYTITATNNGPNPATVEVLDELPQEVTYVGNNLAPPLGCVEFAPGSLRCDVGTLDPAESISFVVKVRVKSSAAVATPSGSLSIVNTATVQSTDTVDPDTSNNTATAVTFAEELSDLKVTKICKPDTELLAGETATCTVFVDNRGPSDARNVHLTDANLSDGSFSITGVTPSQGTCDPPAAGVVTCDLGNLEAASPSVPGRATVAIDITATEAMDINDLATVVSDTPDPNLANNEAQDSVSVTAVSDLSLVKTDSPDPVVAGATLTYTLTTTNNGPSTASNVVVQDVLNSNVSIVSVSATGGASCNAGTPGDPFLPTTCAFDSMAPSASETMTIVVTVNSDVLGVIHNDARVSSDTFDDDNSNDFASEDTTVVAEADLEIWKVDLPDPVVAGTTLTYELTVVNHGPSDAVGVVVEDALPPEVTFKSATISNGSGTCVVFNEPPNTVSCQLDTVPPNVGSPILIYIDVMVSTDVPDGSIISNSATVSSSTTDPDATNNTTAADTTVATEADLEIQKDANFETGNPSTTIIYTITVINHGPSDAQNVTVVDTLPGTPKKVIFVFETSNGACAYVESTHTVDCDFGTLAAGASVSFDIHIQTKGNLGTITNTATVSSTTTDPDLSNNTASKDMLVQGGSDKPGGPGGGRGKGGGTP